MGSLTLSNMKTFVQPDAPDRYAASAGSTHKNTFILSHLPAAAVDRAQPAASRNSAPQYLHLQRLKTHSNNVQRPVANRTVYFVNCHLARLFDLAWRDGIGFVAVEDAVGIARFTQLTFQDYVQGLALRGIGIGYNDGLIIIQNSGEGQGALREWRYSKGCSIT